MWSNGSLFIPIFHSSPGFLDLLCFAGEEPCCLCCIFVQSSPRHPAPQSPSWFHYTHLQVGRPELHRQLTVQTQQGIMWTALFLVLRSIPCSFQPSQHLVSSPDCLWAHQAICGTSWASNWVVAGLGSVCMQPWQGLLLPCAHYSAFIKAGFHLSFNWFITLTLEKTCAAIQ